MTTSPDRVTQRVAGPLPPPQPSSSSSGGSSSSQRVDSAPAESNQPAQPPITTNDTAPPEELHRHLRRSRQRSTHSTQPRASTWSPLSELGWTMTHASETKFGGQYSFEHADGRTLDVSTIPGGEDGFAARVGGEERVVVGRWHVLRLRSHPRSRWRYWSLPG